MAEDEALTIRQVARQLAVSEATIRRYIQEGHFPNSYRLAGGTGHFRIPQSDVDNFKDAGKQSTTG